MCDIIDATLALIGWLVGRFLPPNAIATITEQLEKHRRIEKESD